MIKTIIIEDESHLRETNRLLLENNFPDIQIVGEAAGVGQSIELITKLKPELVLCDIELEDGNIFQVLQKCKPYAFRPVFITAFNHYALKAIKFSAIDYILKPVNEFEFCEAIQKAIDCLGHQTATLQTENLMTNVTAHELPKKVALRTSDTIHIIDIQDILYCKSDNSYTTFYFQNKKEITVSRGIKEFSDLFAEHRFLRPHQSYLVNLGAITKIDKTDGGFIIIANGAQIPISLRRKQAILDELNNL